MPYPMVVYAHKIGKNTADFTTSDMVNFTRWWMKQPLDKEFMMSANKNTYKKNNISEEAEQFKKAMDEVATEQEVVVEIGLTQQDINALVWGINELLTDYNFSGMQEVGESLINLGEVLNPLAEGE